MFRTEDGAIVGSIDVSQLTDEEKRQLGIEVEDAAAPDDDDDEDLSKLLKADLVERAQAAGIDTDGLTKAELIEALEGDDFEDDDDTEPEEDADGDDQLP